MAVDKLNYAQYQGEHAAIDACIHNIEEELNTANSKLTEATADASGVWASTDIDDWNMIYSDINSKFNRLQELMIAAAAGVTSTSETEQAVSGFANAIDQNQGL